MKSSRLRENICNIYNKQWVNTISKRIQQINTNNTNNSVERWTKDINGLIT